MAASCPAIASDPRARGHLVGSDPCPRLVADGLAIGHVVDDGPHAPTNGHANEATGDPERLTDHAEDEGESRSQDHDWARSDDTAGGQPQQGDGPKLIDGRH